jgi:hypothetical protein
MTRNVLACSGVWGCPRFIGQRCGGGSSSSSSSTCTWHPTSTTTTSRSGTYICVLPFKQLLCNVTILCFIWQVRLLVVLSLAATPDALLSTLQRSNMTQQDCLYRSDLLAADAAMRHRSATVGAVRLHITASCMPTSLVVSCTPAQ